MSSSPGAAAATTAARTTAPEAAPMLGRAVKVSVVVPTYAPGDRINGLVASLDAQTMPTSDFEVIYVDDGSPDDTWSRLERIRDGRDNVRIERIPNSGWPSRPRNVGLELARGEYVLFMDHDDELYPPALEAGYATAVRCGADVLNGKETRTDQSKWALEVYRRDMDNAVERQDIHPLIPTNPHKLFRRQLLMDHGIRFPEGRRVLWEDVFFCLDVARHAKVVTVMASTPFYHWVRKGKTASSSYTKDRQEYWRWVREIVLQVNERLGDPALAEQWRLMLLHQYRSRVLAPLGPSLFAASKAVVEHVKGVVTEIVGTHIPEELDAYLTPTQLGRAVLVRQGRWDLLQRLVQVDAGLVGVSRATSVRWSGGRLQLACESRWATGQGAPLALRYDGSQVVRHLPDDVAAALPAAALDMGPSLAAAATGIGIRARDTGLTWMLPGSSEPRVEDVGGRPELVVSATAELDPQSAVFGRPLDSRSWDLTARNELLGAINQRGLRSAEPARSAVGAGRVYIAYPNLSGMASLDVDEANRSLAGSARLDQRRAAFSAGSSTAGRWPLRRRTFTAQVLLPFSGVSTWDDSVIEGTATVGSGEPVPARVLAKPDGAWLETTVSARPGTHAVSLNLCGRDVDAGLQLTVAGNGSMSLARPSAKAR